MAKNLIQKVIFKNTIPKSLYDLYMNAKKHTKATAAPAKITNKVGSKFSVHGGYITGENLCLINNSLVVQTWRAQEWDKDAPDSIFILQFEKKGKNTIVHMVHAGVPDKSAASLDKGWHQHYWEPWKKYLAGKPIASHPTM